MGSHSVKKQKHTVSARKSRKQKGTSPLRSESTLFDFVLSAGAACMLVAAVLIPSSGIVRLLVFAIPYLLLGYKVFISDLDSVLALDFFNYRITCTIASLCAFIIEKYPEAVLIMLFCRLCDFIISYLDKCTDNRIAQLKDLRPATATVETVDGYTAIDASEIRIGNRIIVEREQKIPADGIVLDGNSYVDAFPLNRQSVKKTAVSGTYVYAGSKNYGERLVIRAVAEASDSFISKSMKKVEEALDKKSRLLQRVNTLSVIIGPVFAIFAVVLAVFPALKDENWTQWIYRSLMLLIMSGLSLKLCCIDFTLFSGICSAAELGIIYPDANEMEKLTKVDTYIFSKTGIITENSYKVEEIFPVGLSGEVLLNFAAKAESSVKHPIASAVTYAADQQFLRSAISSHVEVEPGMGVSALVNGARVCVGNAEYISGNCDGIVPSDKGGSIVFVSINGKYRGSILLTSKIRSGIFDYLENLRVLNAKTLVLLTGDVQSTARKIASSLNFDMVRAELSPEDKLSSVEHLMNNKNADSGLVYVGNTASDSELMKAADLGVSVGSLDCEDVLDYGDTVLIDDSIKLLPTAVKLAIATVNSSRKGLLVYSVFQLIAILLSALGLLGLAPAMLISLSGIILPIVFSMKLYYYKDI